MGVAVTSQQVDEWRAAVSEHQRLEFKEAKRQFDFKKLCEYAVALANEGGGTLLLGIADRPPREVVGTSAFPDTVSLAQKLHEKLGFRVDIDAVKHPDGRVVALLFPARPSGSACHLDGTYLMRAGEALVPMSEDQLRRIFLEGRLEWIESPARTGVRAQEVIELLDTQALFELLGLPYPSDRRGVINRLEQEKLIDATDGGFSIRRAGALLFAKQLSDFGELARKAPRVVVYDGTSKLETKLDQPGTKGYAAGFQGLIRFVMAQLPQGEVIRDGVRKEVRQIPEIAVRELIANALIHQDLEMSGAAVMIEIYADRIEISNPGTPIVPIPRFIDGYQSRNERLAGLMRRVGICEEKSSGIDKVIHACEEHQLPAPDFREGHRRTQAILHVPRGFDRMDRDDRVRACYQHCALRWVASEWMTNQSLRARFQLPESKSAIVSQVIAATIDAGFVKPDEKPGGSRKYARYLPFWA